MQTIAKAILWGQDKLKKRAIETYALDSRVLLAHILQKDRSYLIMEQSKELSDDVHESFKCAIKRREKNEPIAYIIGTKEFYGHDFFVNNHVLIPRDLSENLIEYMVKQKNHRDFPYKICDLGTGSGCLAISLLLYFKNATIEAWDVSKKALMVAKKNADYHRVNDRCWFIEKNFCALKDEWKERLKYYDMIVANPPYIDDEGMRKLESNVKNFEPEIALYGGIDGLKYYGDILPFVQKTLKKEGIVAMECSTGQEKILQDFFHGTMGLHDDQYYVAQAQPTSYAKLRE